MALEEVPAIRQTGHRGQSTPDRPPMMLEGEMVVGSIIEDTLLLVMGIGNSTGEQVTAFLNGDPELNVKASLITWLLREPSPAGTHGFVAIVPINVLRRGSLKSIIFQHRSKSAQYKFTSRAASVSDFAAMIGDLAGKKLPDVVDALVEGIISGQISRRKLSAITVLLQSCGRSDGCIELIGDSDEGEIFVQGWSRELTPAVTRLLISGKTSSLAESSISIFARPDVAEGASGFAGLLQASEQIDPSEIERILFRGQKGWRFTDVYDRRQIAGPRETPGHVRAIIPSVRSSTDVLLRMRSAANRFDGSETISGLPFPVRLGIDHVYHVEGSGVLISGWLLDPDSHVKSVKLRRDRGAVKIDDNWSRYDRPDVTQEFYDKRPFQGALDQSRHPHGFVAFASEIEADTSAPFYLELDISDGRRAFFPLSATKMNPRTAIVRQIRAIDPNSWALHHIVDQQLVQLLTEVSRPAPEVANVADSGDLDSAYGPAIIIGLDEQTEEVEPLLALLALDYQTRAAPIVVAAATAIIDRIGVQVRRIAKFYRLNTRLVSVNGAEDLYDAFEAGASTVATEQVVFLAGSLLPYHENWYEKLVSAHKDHRDSVLSPTLIYEDNSIRWAGTWLAEPEFERALVSRYVGYPVDAVTGIALTEVSTATFECCILPREAIAAVGGFTRGYLGTHEKGLDFGLKLKQSGVLSYWLPSAQMLGADEFSLSEKPTTNALIEKIDRRLFDQRWSTTLSNEAQQQAENA